MLKALVVADDLTGAAEVAGVARLAGFSVAIVTQLATSVLHSYEVVVLDTHTRAHSPQKAARQIAHHFDTIEVPAGALVFKKTDSVLRGPVAAELTALMRVANFRNVLLLPANPSKGRTIAHGIYYINGVPIHRTDFRWDADYPVRAPHVKDLLRGHQGALVYHDRLPQVAGDDAGKIITTAVETTADLEQAAIFVRPTEVLCAGGADFFSALLTVRFRRTLLPHDLPGPQIAGLSRYFIIGSHTASSSSTLQRLRQAGSVVHQLTNDMLHQAGDFPLAHWLSAEATAERSVVFARPDERTQGVAFQKTITNRLIAVAQHIAAQAPARSHLLVEGGATASGLIRSMNWQTLRVEQAYQQGAVSLSGGASFPLLTIKPGSYHWPAAFLR